MAYDKVMMMMNGDNRDLIRNDGEGGNSGNEIEGD